MSNDGDYKHLNTLINMNVTSDVFNNTSKAITNACSYDKKNPEEFFKRKLNNCQVRSVRCSRRNHWVVEVIIGYIISEK